MENVSCLPDFGNNDVISFSSCMHKVGKFRAAVDTTFAGNKIVYDVSNALQSKVGISSLDWFDEGVSCEILRLGSQSWRKGKLRITINVEFCPDQPIIEQKTVSKQIEINQSESSLDDIRHLTAQNRQQENL